MAVRQQARTPVWATTRPSGSQPVSGNAVSQQNPVTFTGVRHFVQLTGVSKQIVPRLARYCRRVVRGPQFGPAAAAAVMLGSWLFGEWCAVRSRAYSRRYGLPISQQGHPVPNRGRPGSGMASPSLVVVQDYTQQAYRPFAMALIWPALALRFGGKDQSHGCSFQASTYSRFLARQFAASPG